MACRSCHAVHALISIMINELVGFSFFSLSIYLKMSAWQKQAFAVKETTHLMTMNLSAVSLCLLVFVDSGYDE